jgi:hypothetical protein
LIARTDLPAVLESAFEDAFRHLRRLGIVQHHAGVIPTKLERAALQRFRGTLSFVT